MQLIVGANMDKSMHHDEILSITTVLLNASGQELAVVLASNVDRADGLARLGLYLGVFSARETGHIADLH